MFHATEIAGLFEFSMAERTRPAFAHLNVATGKTLEDELPSARYFERDVAPDGASIYYARNNKGGTLLYQHVLGRAIRGTR
jgi:hypothetical protein